MSKNLPEALRGLYAILDETLIVRGNPRKAARSLVECGVGVIQYRAKKAGAGYMLEAAAAINEECSKCGALFIVNDRADVAMISGAPGVHVGQDDLPVSACRKVMGEDAVVGVSTHSEEEIEAAVRNGADYIGYGPVFGTSTKENPLEPRGLDALAEVVSSVDIPVVAIGGINVENIGEVRKAGAAGAAVISALASKSCLEEGAKALVEAWEKAG